MGIFVFTFLVNRHENLSAIHSCVLELLAKFKRPNLIEAKSFTIF